MRKHGRTDANHAAIVVRFRAYGWTVQSLANLGGGCADLLVCDRRQRLHLVEVKARTGKLTPAQVEQFARWPVTVVRSVEDVDELVKVRR